MGKILIIEDEESIAMPLQDDLTLEGYRVQTARNGTRGLQMARENRYDLIILDIMLPELSGFQVLKTLRAEKITTPVLMLTAKSTELDKVLGLELGADDYVTKPFSPRELLARVKAILRRAHAMDLEIDSIRFGDVEVDFRQYEAKKAGKAIDLTAVEFALLHLLVKHANEVLSRDKILDEIWGEEVYVTPRTVDTHVAHLRRKLEDDPARPKFILGVRGVGYKFVV